MISKGNLRKHLSVDNDIIQKSGSWYSYGEKKIGQGRDATKNWLRESHQDREEIKQRVKQVLGMVEAPEAAPSKNGKAVSA